MAGYLGKISAIVTANTSDFNSKLSASAKEVRSFAASMQSSITRAQSGATSSLRGIYTEAQKLERALKAASTMSLSFKGFDASKFKNVEEAANQMRRVASAAEQIYKPLQAAAKASESLATEVRAGFQPALVKAQQQAELLNTAITKGMAVSEQSFARVERRVLDTAAAMSRLTEASEIAGSGPRGTELAFADPRVRDALTQSAAIRQRAAGASADAITGGGLASDVQKLASIDSLIQKRRAEIESATVLNIDTTRARASLENLLSLADKVRGRLSSEIDSFEQMGARTDISMMGRSSPVFLGNGRGNPTGSFGPTLPPGFGGSSDAGLGRGIDDGLRRLEQLRAGIVSAKNQLDAMPDSVRTHFIPSIQAAEMEFVRLAAMGPRAVGDEIENAVNNMRVLEAAAQRATRAFSFGQMFGGGTAQGFELAAQGNSLQGYQSQLQILQQTLGRLSTEARGPAIASFIALQTAISRAFQEGTLDAAATRAEIDRLTAEAVEATAAVAGVGSRGLAERMRRAGDVGRAGVDRFSLALNQAAFAIDDFFSSVGGIEHRIRAVSNNITQLSFILGGTRGLFIGLGAVIGAQAVLGLIRWVNSGRTAEDTTKALNDSLSRQKSLVEELAQAFESLGDSMARKGLSKSAQDARDFEKEMRSVEQKQKELREERAAAVSPEVVEAKASVNVAKNKLDKATTVGESVIAQRELDAAERRLKEARQNVVSRPAVTAAEAKSVIDNVLRNEARARASAAARNEDNPVAKQMAVARELAAGEERVRSARVAGNPEEIKKALEQQIQDLIDRGAPPGAIARLQSLIDSLELPIQTLRDQALVGILRASNELAASIGQGQQIIDDAFGDSASTTRNILDRAERELEALKSRAEASGSPDLFQADIAVLGEFVDELKTAAMAVRSFSDEMNRIAESFSSDVASRQQMAEEARREDLRKGTPESAARRDRAEEEARAATQAEREFKDAQATARERIEQDMLQNGQSVADRMRQIDEQLAVPANEMGANGINGGTVAEREQLRKERRELQATVDAEVAASPEVEDQRRRRDEQTRRLERDKEQREQASRGRDLAATPGQRAAKDLNENLESIRQFFGEQAELGNGLVDEKAQREAMQRQIEEARKSVAPMVFDMAQARENAILGGPSRAALNASDVTTMEGQKELNRLLRGDDSAKDINLAELQKQTQQLQDLNQGIDDLNAQLAGVAV
jgi:hypothetical protein